MSADQDIQQTKRDRQKARRAERLQQQAVQHEQEARKRTVFKLLAAIVGVALIGGIGYLLAQGVDVSLGVEAATVDDDATPLPPTAEGGSDAAIGAAAPEVTGQDFDGEPTAIGVPGQPQAVVFMAHWCSFCQEEMPLIDDWVADGLLADGVELVGVTTRHDPARVNWPADEWFEEEEFPGTVLVDSDEAAADAWGLTGTPMWVFTDAEGIVVARYSGVIDADRFAEGSSLAAGGQAQAED